MPNREDIANLIIAARQKTSVEEEMINFLQNALVADEDGIYRVLDSEIDVDELRRRARGNKFKANIKTTTVNQNAPEKGYLIISPRQSGPRQGEDAPAPRHLALKVDSNKFWTISAIKGGTELEIGILENGEHRAVISFKEDSALALKKELKLGAGLQAIDESKGIPTSGLKGFKEGRLYGSNQWQGTGVKIPKGTFGKYRLQAWLIQPHQNRFSHLETVFIFFPGKQPIQKVKNQSVNSSTLKKLYYMISEWWAEKILKRSTEEDQGKWLDRLVAKANEDDGEIMLKCIRRIDADRKIIYYTIERLWEGEYWAEDKAEEPPQTETE